MPNMPSSWTTSTLPVWASEVSPITPSPVTTTRNYLDPANGYQVPLPSISQQAQTELTRRENDIARQEMDEVADANAASAGRVNMAAMASARRRAGGTTFRRRGSGVSANQLVSGLGAANASARAAKRREMARSEVSQGIGWTPQPMTSTLGPVVAQVYY